VLGAAFTMMLGMLAYMLLMVISTPAMATLRVVTVATFIIVAGDTPRSPPPIRSPGDAAAAAPPPLPPAGVLAFVARRSM
jgi:hypothetical protein